MSDVNLLGYWIRRFLLEHLVGERNLARNTQRSYRDTLTLLLPFVSGKLNRPVDRLTIVDVSADLVRLFLLDLEESRECGIATRNQRLAAVHALKAQHKAPSLAAKRVSPHTIRTPPPHTSFVPVWISTRSEHGSVMSH